MGYYSSSLSRERRHRVAKRRFVYYRSIGWQPLVASITIDSQIIAFRPRFVQPFLSRKRVGKAGPRKLVANAIISSSSSDVIRECNAEE